MVQVSRPSLCTHFPSRSSHPPPSQSLFRSRGKASRILTSTFTMAPRIAFIFLFLSLLSLAFAGDRQRFPHCTGEAMYNLTIYNRWVPSRFEDVPSGAHFSPLTFFSHSSRFSSVVLRGYASPGVQAVAETGDNTVLKKELANAGTFVKQVSATETGAESGASFYATVKVDCQHTVVSAITMVAPSPDWFIAITNMNVFRRGRFIKRRAGRLRAFDAGTDSGKTPTAEDVPTVPVQNIARLRGAPFMRRPIARYVLTRL